MNLNLNVVNNSDQFLNYNFNETSSSKLVLIQQNEQVIIKSLKKEELERLVQEKGEATFKTSLKKIAQFIESQQLAWHSVLSAEQKVILETQCAYLNQKVQKHNQRFLNPKINYDHPFKFNIQLEVELCTPSNVTLNTKLHEGKLKYQMMIDRTTTVASILKGTDQISKRKISFTIDCSKKDTVTYACGYGFHQFTANIGELFQECIKSIHESQESFLNLHSSNTVVKITYQGWKRQAIERAVKERHNNLRTQGDSIVNLEDSPTSTLDLAGKLKI